MKDKMLQQQYNQRALKDQLARYFVSLGGISVIIAILLIFFYLLHVVIPMFESAEVNKLQTYSIPDEGKTLYIGLEEQGGIGVRVLDNGKVAFFNTESGATVLEEVIELPAKITSTTANLDRVVLGFENGQVLVLKYVFDLSYPDDVRTITPRLEYPLGESPLELDEAGQALTQLSFQLSNDGAGFAATTIDDRLVFASYIREESFISEEITTELDTRSVLPLSGGVNRLSSNSLALEPGLEHLYVVNAEQTLFDYTLSEDGINEQPQQFKFDKNISSIKLLLGGSSLLIGLESGEVQQWMPVRADDLPNDASKQLTYIRSFNEGPKSVSVIETEQRRKGFAVADEQGSIVLYYTTSERTLAHIQGEGANINLLAWSARAQHLLAVDDKNQMHFYKVHNEYPEVSWGVLWGKVWYEGYDEPDYIWQSSASTNEFEPKFSLMPLSFGTIKAAFYAMLFAVPIAILGAMFTAQFMAPKMRQTVKPSIEIMEALPTVILGFLAGLWLAPYVESHLAGIFTLLIILPFGFIICAWLWGYVPNKSQLEGWEAALLIPVVIFMIWLSMTLSSPIEHIFFDGDLRQYMSSEWGMGYDQRNSLVVGLIMGFAVIPTIFSIAEDALFSVPQHLIRGSLALGATRWQTMMFVVLPAASPGIFSAVMMGFGRAVGETMIVLMATGNTPLMDMSIFQGMRTLAANIAVEVPEAEVASTHYRILFLAALILFMFTFVFNTLAELIRHRLRKRYSGL